MRGDAVNVTGIATVHAPTVTDYRRPKARRNCPCLGSEISSTNVAHFAADADGFIVGSEFKTGGRMGRAR